jgi:quinol monooxygenase YgiN
MFGLVVRFDLRDDHSASAFDALVAATLEQIEANEPGTLVYAVHQVEGAPLSRIFYELYQDRAAFDTHEQQEHTKRFLAEREQYLQGKRVEFLGLQHGKGV